MFYLSGYLPPGYCNFTAMFSRDSPSTGWHFCSSDATSMACIMTGCAEEALSPTTTSSPVHILGWRRDRLRSTRCCCSSRVLRLLRASIMASQSSSPSSSPDDSIKLGDAGDRLDVIARRLRLLVVVA